MKAAALAHNTGQRSQSASPQKYDNRKGTLPPPGMRTYLECSPRESTNSLNLGDGIVVRRPEQAATQTNSTGKLLRVFGPVDELIQHHLAGLNPLKANVPGFTAQAFICS